MQILWQNFLVCWSSKPTRKDSFARQTTCMFVLRKSLRTKVQLASSRTNTYWREALYLQTLRRWFHATHQTERPPTKLPIPRWNPNACFDATAFKRPDRGSRCDYQSSCPSSTTAAAFDSSTHVAISFTSATPSAGHSELVLCIQLRIAINKALFVQITKKTSNRTCPLLCVKREKSPVRSWSLSK